MYVIMVIELFCLRISQCPDKPCLNVNVLVAALPSRLKQYCGVQTITPVERDIKHTRKMDQLNK